METTKLKRFAQAARRSLISQISAKLKLILADGSAARREHKKAVTDLEKQIASLGTDQVVEQVAYTWFNRFCALRFMDLNGYSKVHIVSSTPGRSQPEILTEAKMGNFYGSVSIKNKERIQSLLSGTAQSHDAQGEAYRLLVVAACNTCYGAMPFLFERIDDYTELLLPDNLLASTSILTQMHEAMTQDACRDVEVIGWLYQFYISERKEEVFAGLKKSKKAAPQDIPAATQLFTPHWIVRYLVENSLGRLWVLNHPSSKLIEQMDYFIAPEQAEDDFLRIDYPEEIKICDPACGSGHMLTYAFDLLYLIYEEEGYDPADVPELILKHNLYGIEIDTRAGELASFALSMKARSKQKKFLSTQVIPHICVLENIDFEKQELKEYIKIIGEDFFTPKVMDTLYQFTEADNFGSLIRPRLQDSERVLNEIKTKELSNNLFLQDTHKKVQKTLEQAAYLSQRYHVVVANPPYMGGKGMNARLGGWAKEQYPGSKSDLFAMFIERGLSLIQNHGYSAMVTMQSWMFLSSYQKLRATLLNNGTILSMAHLGARAFDSIGGEVVSTTAFVYETNVHAEYKGSYLRIVDKNSEDKKQSAILEAIRNSECGWFYRASAADFKKIPGSPIAYWVSSSTREAFVNSPTLGSQVDSAVGLFTCNNDRFLRNWFEISLGKIGFGCTNLTESLESRKRYFPLQKGGGFRKWYGLNSLIVQYGDDGKEIRIYRKKVGQSWSLPGEDYYFRRGITWSGLTKETNSFRWCGDGFIFESNKGQMLFADSAKSILAYLNSIVCTKFIACINPTLSVQSNEIKRLPFVQPFQISQIENIVKKLVETGQSDWDSYETSWDFTTLPLLQPEYRQSVLKGTYETLRAHWKEMTLEMQRLEEENNLIFIEAYGLQDELAPDVPLKEITLTCNPYYRYGDTKSDKQLEELLLGDTMKEFISYSVGCMFGRYALEKPGLVLANQGETLEDYLDQIPEPIFLPDEENVIPILDTEWFTDDIVGRFRKFLKLTFGEEHYDENMAFIEKALGKDIRSYFIKDFYNDHVRRYKKRPIYWLFSSPRGSFNALIYMHRYRPYTVSVVLNEYLREFRAKLTARLEHVKRVETSTSASKTDRVQAVKEIESLKRIIDELTEYEDTILYPLATKQVEIDLDDGVKVNYPKLRDALKKITGLST